jgi:hypothetical protein
MLSEYHRPSKVTETDLCNISTAILDDHSVAARRFDDEPTLLASLAVSVNKLAWAEI